MINWYPGHMTKSMRMIEDNLKLIDIIIYVLDSRAPYSCINPSFDELIRGMPVIYVLNKADLGSRSEVAAWTDILSTNNSTALAITGTASKSTAPIISMIKKLCFSKIERYKAKGVRTTIKAMVLGVPNTGKSTIINTLCGSAKTITGNKAGVTRGKQWVRINDFLEVLDTPGTLYPKLSDQNIARHLAYLGSIKDEVVDSFELSLSLIKELTEVSPELLTNRYGITLEGDALEVLEKIALKRGFIFKGKEADTIRAATAVLEDFRKGRMGVITLDKACDMVKK